MRYVLSILAAFTFLGQAAAQDSAPQPKFRNAYYECRRAAHQREGMPRQAIVFLGNSITEQGWWSVLIPDKEIVNRGIGGDNTYGMLDRLAEILEYGPRKIFLMAGINDLSAGYPVEHIVENIGRMADLVQSRTPDCTLYIQSVLTPNDDVLAYPYIKGKQAKVNELNSRLKELCRERGITYIDIAPLLSDERGQVRTELTKDGIHIHPEAYRIWVEYLNEHEYLK